LLVTSTAFVAYSQLDDIGGILGNDTAGLVDPSFLTPFIDSVLGESPIEFTCETSDDCSGLGSGFECNLDAGLCIFGCSSDDDCQELGAGTGLGSCVDGSCQVNEVCSSDDDCASLIGFTCGNDGSCQDPATCSDDTDCTMAGLSCNADFGVCEPSTCSESSDCSTGYVCVAETGYCIESCVSSATNVCAGPLFCDTDSGLCAFECTADSDCTGFTNTCSDGTCVLTCQTTADCDAIGIPSAECITVGEGEEEIGTCVPSQDFIIGGDSCTSDADCSGGAICETEVGVCYTDCMTSDDCDGTAQCVDASTLPMVGEMVPLPDGTMTCAEPNALECDNDSDCSDGYKCNALLGSTCYPSCSNDADCAALGFGDDTPCVTNSYSLVLTTIEIKFCDPSQTPAPTMADDSAANGLSIVISAIAALVLSVGNIM